MNLVIRNASKTKGGIYMELKNEGKQLLGKKLWISLDLDSTWHVFQVPLPKSGEFNYLAFSDIAGKLELKEISFADK